MCLHHTSTLFEVVRKGANSWISARPNFENFGVGHRIVFKHIYISFEIQCRKVNKLLINFPSLFQFTFTNSEWLEASFQKRECAKIIPSSKDPTRWGRNCIDFNRIANTFALSLYCVSSYYVNHSPLEKGLFLKKTSRWELKKLLQIGRFLSVFLSETC